MAINLTKKYKTECGYEVTLLSVDGLMPEPVVGYIDGKLHTWRADGTYGLTCFSGMDLVEAKPEPKFEVGEFAFHVQDDRFCKIIFVDQKSHGVFYKCVLGVDGPEYYFREEDLIKS